MNHFLYLAPYHWSDGGGSKKQHDPEAFHLLIIFDYQFHCNFLRPELMGSDRSLQWIEMKQKYAELLGG